MKRESAVSYIRVSTDEQVRGVGLLVQEKAIAQYVKRVGLRIDVEYRDEGISGSTIAGRPGLLELIEQVEFGNVKNIVVYAIDRLSRNLDDLRILRKLCIEQKVAIHTMNGKVAFASVEGNLFYNITGLMAETEMLIIQQRTRDALAEKKSQHKRTGSVPYGFYVKTNNTLVKKTAEQKVVKYVITKWKNGYNLAQIVRRLAKKKYLTRTGKNFVAQQVKRIVEG